jgi:general secretion pathway protein F
VPSFRYKAMTPSGTVTTGVLEAPSRDLLIQQLQGRGQYPISATDMTEGRWRAWLGRELFRRGIRARELSLASHELAMLLHAGLALDRALEILLGLGETARLREPLTAVLARVRNGASLADALADEASFPRIYVSMVRAGELGGSLEAALRRLADYLAKVAEIRDAVTSAMVYPIILLATAGLSISVILVFVLPQFRPLFASTGKPLPFVTQIVMTAGDFLTKYWWALALTVIVLVLGLRHLLARPEIRQRVDRLVLRLPLFGDLSLKIEMERFSRTLGMLLGNGVALPAALAITKDTLANSVVAAAVGETGVGLREGEGLAERLARTRIFPPIVLDMIRVGEETGRLDAMLLRQAELSENSVRHTVDRLLALLVPLLTVVLGFVVAGLIASLVSAILSINDLAAQ